LLFSISRTANFVVRVRTTNGRTGAPCIGGRASIHATNPASVMELWNEINSIVTTQLLAQAIASPSHPLCADLGSLSQFWMINARFKQISVQSCSTLDNSGRLNLNLPRRPSQQNPLSTWFCEENIGLKMF